MLARGLQRAAFINLEAGLQANLPSFSTYFLLLRFKALISQVLRKVTNG
jgi:hypothetical protein